MEQSAGENDVIELAFSVFVGGGGCLEKQLMLESMMERQKMSMGSNLR